MQISSAVPHLKLHIGLDKRLWHISQVRGQQLQLKTHRDTQRQSGQHNEAMKHCLQAKCIRSPSLILHSANHDELIYYRTQLDKLKNKLHKVNGVITHLLRTAGVSGDQKYYTNNSEVRESSTISNHGCNTVLVATLILFRLTLNCCYLITLGIQSNRHF